MRRRPPRATLFPDTTLFRSERPQEGLEPGGEPPGQLLQALGERLEAGPARPGPAPQRAEHPQQQPAARSEEHTSEPQSRPYLVCRLLLEKTPPTSGSIIALS